MIIYDFDRQRVVNREEGKVISIKPLYNDSKYNQFFALKDELSVLSKKFPEERFIVEMQNVSEFQFNAIKSEVDIHDGFVDHSSKFFLSISLNATIIVHKEY